MTATTTRFHATRSHLFRAYRQGLKDARLGSPDVDGHLPWTRRLHGQCGEHERAVSERLHAALKDIDGRIDVLARESVELVRFIGEMREAVSAHEPARTAGDGAEVIDVVGRLRAKQAHRTLQANALQADSRLAAAAAEASRLLSDRHHTIADARAELTGIVAYFEALTGNHRLGMERRGSTLIGRRVYGPPQRVEVPLPRYVPYSAWFAADVPLVTPGTAEQIALLQWTWTPFEHGPSAKAG
ncbi:MAG TPA: hypothetical protein VFC82_02595 [Actinomycetaceae bacterium]|nr:hypothetical protein [Actinomycetaceae bacterium]